MFSLCPSIVLSILVLFNRKFTLVSLTVEDPPNGRKSPQCSYQSKCQVIHVIPRFVPTPDTVKHSMTNSSYVPPDSPVQFAAGGSQCRRRAADGSTNESTLEAQRSTSESAGAAPRSQSWPPPPAVTYTALLSASSCGDVTNGGGEGGGGRAQWGREVGGGGLPIQQPQHKGKCSVANPWTK
jgi:hypothetical protein